MYLSVGHDFRPSYLQMANQLDQLPNRPVIVALTATATVQVAADIKRLLKIPENNHIQTGFERENLRFQVIKDQKRTISNRIFKDQQKSIWYHLCSNEKRSRPSLSFA